MVLKEFETKLLHKSSQYRLDGWKLGDREWLNINYVTAVAIWILMMLVVCLSPDLSHGCQMDVMNPDSLHSCNLRIHDDSCFLNAIFPAMMRSMWEGFGHSLWRCYLQPWTSLKDISWGFPTSGNCLCSNSGMFGSPSEHVRNFLSKIGFCSAVLCVLGACRRAALGDQKSF